MTDRSALWGQSSVGRALAAAGAGVLAASALLSAAAIAGTGPASVPAAVHVPLTPSTLPATGRMIQRFTAANMIGSFAGTQSDAVDLAKAYDVISATAGQFGRYLPAMRAANPKLIILVYLNGTLAQKSQSSAYPASWYLYSSSGNKVVSRYGNLLMDPTNQGWIDNRTQTCAQLITGGYDGCFVDMLGIAPLLPGYLTALPVDPTTGATYTSTAWVAATAKVGGAVAAAVTPKFVVGNGVSSGTRYFDQTAPTSQLLDPISGGSGEAWLKAPTASAAYYPTAKRWQQNIDALVDAGSHGRSIFAITKTWGAGTADQINAWHLFALASFLLGNDGHSYFAFTRANTQAGIVYDDPWEHANVGQPTGAYTRNADGSYQRLFTTGEAIVNPTSTSVTVTPAHAMCDLGGVSHNSVILGPEGAQVLTDC